MQLRNSAFLLAFQALFVACHGVKMNDLGGTEKTKYIANDMKLEKMENSVQCLDKSFRYKKPPQHNMKVKVQVAILSIDSLSSRKMDLSTDVYLTHEW